MVDLVIKFQFSILSYQKHTRTSFFFTSNNRHFGFQSVSIALLWNWVPPFPPPHPFGHHQKTLAFRREKWDHHDLTYLHTFKPSVAGVVQWALSTCRSVGLLVWTQEKTNRIISVFDSLLKSLKQHPIIYITPGHIKNQPQNMCPFHRPFSETSPDLGPCPGQNVSAL